MDIKFKDLSWTLKIVVIFGYAMLGLTLLAFLFGFMQGVLGA